MRRAVVSQIWKGIKWFGVGTKRYGLWLLATTVTLAATYLLIGRSLSMTVNGISLGTILGTVMVAIDLMVLGAAASGNREPARIWVVFLFMTSFFTMLGAGNILNGIEDPTTRGLFAVLIGLTVGAARTMCLGFFIPAQNIANAVKTAASSQSA